MKNMSSLLAAACLVTTLNAPLRAEPATHALAETVKFADLDMAKDADAVILYQRIRKAAAHVCSPFDSTSLYMQHVYVECQVAAISNAVSTVNTPLLSGFATAQLTAQKRIRLASFARF